MAAPPMVALVGGRNMRKTLKAAGADLKDLSPAYRAASAIVVNVARPQTPHRTGALAKTVRGGGTQASATIRAGSKAVPYGPPIHWGWPTRGIAAQPWLSEAAQSSEPVWVEEFEQLMHDAIAQIRGVS
jgi:hypothetical protein